MTFYYFNSKFLTMNEDTNIAIVGIGCMFPGAENIDEYWNVLLNGEDHVQDIPTERFNVEAFYDPNPDHPRKSYVRKAGLIKRSVKLLSTFLNNIKCIDDFK